ncbi:MAG: hypothetical protein EB059_02880 [Alphaproteobacteria bacterium]|nr:hypothetical protein [Alphaproteobacteria bacterium]
MVMTGHGFRPLAKSTIMEKLNYREEVPDRQLAHAPDTKYGEAYDRSTFLTDRIKMMQDWADYIDELYASALVQYRSANAPVQSA